MATESSGQIEKIEDIGTDSSAVVTRWLREIELADAHEKDWRKRANKVIARYRDERSQNDDNVRFNILYSNVEVLKSVIYAKPPIPDVRRRFLDRDPVGKQASQLLDRALSYSIECADLDTVLKQVVEDVLLPGRGVAKVRYAPTFDDDGQVAYEEAKVDYVEWDMFRMSPAKRWEKVRWVAFGDLLTRADLKKQFREKGERCKLDWCPDGIEDNADNEIFKRALVWTIWDKATRKVFAVCRGFPDSPLAEVADPLRLEDFFPCPRPVYAVSTNGNMIPVPEYTQYQDQATELDNITARIDTLVDALRRRGVYDATFPELDKLARAGDNEFIPVENYANLAEKGGIEKAIMELPIDNIAKVLVNLYGQREQVKQTIYEITGISDIVRGSTSPSETLGAQQLKSQYSNIRTSPRQTALQQFARDIMRLQAEIISEHFSPMTLQMMSGMQIAPEVLQLLKNDKIGRAHV